MDQAKMAAELRLLADKIEAGESSVVQIITRSPEQSSFGIDKHVYLQTVEIVVSRSVSATL